MGGLASEKHHGNPHIPPPLCFYCRHQKLPWARPEAISRPPRGLFISARPCLNPNPASWKYRIFHGILAIGILEIVHVITSYLSWREENSMCRKAGISAFPGVKRFVVMFSSREVRFWLDSRSFNYRTETKILAGFPPKSQFGRPLW